MTTGLDRWNRVCECGHTWAGHSLLDPDEGTRCFECDCQEFFAAQDVAGLDRRNLPAGVGEARPAECKSPSVGGPPDKVCIFQKGHDGFHSWEIKARPAEPHGMPMSDEMIERIVADSASTTAEEQPDAPEPGENGRYYRKWARSQAEVARLREQAEQLSLDYINEGEKAARLREQLDAAHAELTQAHGNIDQLLGQLKGSEGVEAQVSALTDALECLWDKLHPEPRMDGSSSVRTTRLDPELVGKVQAALRGPG